MKKLLTPKLRKILLILIGIFTLGVICLYLFVPSIYYPVIYLIHPPENSYFSSIHMSVPENNIIYENKSSHFELIITNPTNTAILIHECFSLSNISNINDRDPFKDTSIGTFEKKGSTYIIDFDNPSEWNTCNAVTLRPKSFFAFNQHKSYKFVIKNAQEGNYTIDMNGMTMDIADYWQSFGISNIFELHTINN